MCMPLIDKINGRMRHWCSNLLSYAGRMQLMKSVVFSITNYWLQVFALPKKVLRYIDSCCRSFLWGGTNTITRKIPVAWHKVCEPRKASGLNLISLRTGIRQLCLSSYGIWVWGRTRCGFIGCTRITSNIYLSGIINQLILVLGFWKLCWSWRDYTSTWHVWQLAGTAGKLWTKDLYQELCLLYGLYA